MKFSIMLATKLDDWKVYPEIEAAGYDAAWVPDSQMIWSDCYATLALAAHHTSRLELGTGVAIPGTRIAPVTAHSIASINQIAPGRVFLGVGTGHTAMRVMGMNPMRVADFREYLRVLRGLLDGEEVTYTLDGTTRQIRFLHGELGFRNLEDRIPIYVAANGPKALQTAGAYADGLVAIFNEDPDALAYHMGMVRQGAETVERTLPDPFRLSTVTTAVVMRPGETLRSDRVIDACGSQVMCCIHFVYEIVQYTKNEEAIPEFLRGVWAPYCEHVERMQTPPEKRYLQIHDGHCTYHVPEERHFITPEAIEGVCLVGSASEIAERVHKAEAAGLNEVILLPPMAALREVMNDFRQVIEIY